MDNKFYVSLEVARMLREKGYNEETIYYYNSAGKLYLGNGHFNYNAYAVYLSAPSKSEAINWLESNGIVVIVDISFSDETWIYSIYREGEHLYDSIISKESCFLTRLEAEEAAIIKALEIL